MPASASLNSFSRSQVAGPMVHTSFVLRKGTTRGGRDFLRRRNQSWFWTSSIHRRPAQNLSSSSTMGVLMLMISSTDALREQRA